jgi:hypothetical protein
MGTGQLRGIDLSLHDRLQQKMRSTKPNERENLLSVHLGRKLLVKIAGVHRIFDLGLVR